MEAVENGNIIEPSNYEGIKNVIQTIEKNPEKRTLKEKSTLVNLMKELNFFKFRRPLNEDELTEM